MVKKAEEDFPRFISNFSSFILKHFVLLIIVGAPLLVGTDLAPRSEMENEKSEMKNEESVSSW